MKIAIMQPYLFPYIGYFQMIDSVDIFVSGDDVQFIKGGWINRNNIFINNQSKLFTFSVKKDLITKNINERYYIMSDYEIKKFKKQITMNYNKAKNFNDTIELIDEILSYEDLNVANFNMNSIKIICNYIGIERNFIELHRIPKNSMLKKEEKIIEVCKKLKCNVYVNSIGGMELYKNSYFEENGIELFFVKNEVKGYKQFTNEFIPNLSIIDVLMHNSEEEVKELVSQYSLIKNV